MQKQMYSWSLRAMQRFTCVYFQAQTAVDVGDVLTWWTTVILITAKTLRPPFWAPCRDKNCAGSGISLVYLCRHYKCDVQIVRIYWYSFSRYLHTCKHQLFNWFCHTVLIVSRAKSHVLFFSSVCRWLWCYYVILHVWKLLRGFTSLFFTFPVSSSD